MVTINYHYIFGFSTEELYFSHRVHAFRNILETNSGY
jgi:hypothetical protein